MDQPMAPPIPLQHDQRCLRCISDGFPVCYKDSKGGKCMTCLPRNANCTFPMPRKPVDRGFDTHHDTHVTRFGKKSRAQNQQSYHPIPQASQYTKRPERSTSDRRHDQNTYKSSGVSGQEQLRHSILKSTNPSEVIDGREPHYTTQSIPTESINKNLMQSAPVTSMAVKEQGLCGRCFKYRTICHVPADGKAGCLSCRQTGNHTLCERAPVVASPAHSEENLPWSTTANHISNPVVPFPPESESMVHSPAKKVSWGLIIPIQTPESTSSMVDTPTPTSAPVRKRKRRDSDCPGMGSAYDSIFENSMKGQGTTNMSTVFDGQTVFSVEKQEQSLPTEFLSYFDKAKMNEHLPSNTEARVMRQHSPQEEKKGCPIFDLDCGSLEFNIQTNQKPPPPPPKQRRIRRRKPKTVVIPEVQKSSEPSDNFLNTTIDAKNIVIPVGGIQESTNATPDLTEFNVDSFLNSLGPMTDPEANEMRADVSYFLSSTPQVDLPPIQTNNIQIPEDLLQLLGFTNVNLNLGLDTDMMSGTIQKVGGEGSSSNCGIGSDDPWGFLTTGAGTMQRAKKRVKIGDGATLCDRCRRLKLECDSHNGAYCENCTMAGTTCRHTFKH